MMNAHKVLGYVMLQWPVINNQLKLWIRMHWAIQIWNAASSARTSRDNNSCMMQPSTTAQRTEVQYRDHMTHTTSVFALQFLY